MIRVKVKSLDSSDDQSGEWLGLMYDEHGDICAVVRLDGHGLMLTMVHPSRVEPD